MSITRQNAYPIRKRSLVSNLFSNDIETVHIPTNIKETTNEFLIELIVPGFKKEFFDIGVEQNKLSISYKSIIEKNESEEAEVPTEKFLVKGYEVKDFAKVFRLPENVEVNNLSAKFNQGILVVSLPKSEEKLPVKIQVQ
ncbi:Hsp20/alpha crystallin family protein [Flammeovirga kamogawensis]|uniref:Hsp20/alpha crystallin family protein n=1 Tax=Flammeovirga kamogawensis TaxID=373891 RepID=A0ABX8GTW7_9BACT|nr:Hsp20/alpha crystallin family protein [Flammeovirga kamogawensis]MBB6461488.1 HSP20 family protein [Flammeovirga kamogawensis]QWG06380.1 Hsp20/alpha crystallin family protein [Flammeovirga kamogawensis]TRX68209.1 Hsp20/alpha crystallin family protein [Flammeovirga kamogawensis]